MVRDSRHRHRHQHARSFRDMVRAGLANNKLRREHGRVRQMHTPFDPLKHQAGIIDLARGRNHDPGHALGQHQIDIQLLLLNVFVGVAEKHGILMLISDIFDSTCEDIEKGF
jgi:hypothetical protein